MPGDAHVNRGEAYAWELLRGQGGAQGGAQPSSPDHAIGYVAPIASWSNISNCVVRSLLLLLSALFFILSYSTREYTVVLYFASRIVSPALFETYNRIDDPKKGFWASSIVSNIHSVIVFGMATSALVNNPSFLTSTDFSLSTPESLRTCRCFLGYIVCDLLVSLWYNKKWAGWIPNLMHHGFIVLCWSQLISGQCGQLFALVGALCEASTPFVNQRWFMAEAGMQKSPLYVANGLAMMATFFAFRVVGFLWMGTRLVAQREGLLALPASSSGTLLLSYGVGTALQLFWFSKIARGAAKVMGLIGGTKEKKEKKNA